MAEPPLPEDVFVARWRDRLALAVKDDESAAKFARFMQSIANKIEITLRPGFGDLVAQTRGRR